MAFTNAEAQTITNIVTKLAGKNKWHSYADKLDAIRHRLELEAPPVPEEDTTRPMLPAGDPVAALRPFANYAEHMKGQWGHHDDCVFYGVKHPGAPQITYGDFRNAASTIAAIDNARPLATLMVCLNEVHLKHCKLAFGADAYAYAVPLESFMGRKFGGAIIFTRWDHAHSKTEMEQLLKWIEEQVATKLPPDIKPIYV